MNCRSLLAIRTEPGPIGVRRALETSLVIGSRTSVANDQITSFKAVEAIIDVDLSMALLILSSLETLMRKLSNAFPYIEVLWTNNARPSNEHATSRNTFIIFVFFVLGIKMIGSWASNAFEHFSLKKSLRKWA